MKTLICGMNTEITKLITFTKYSVKNSLFAVVFESKHFLKLEVSGFLYYQSQNQLILLSEVEGQIPSCLMNVGEILIMFVKTH